MTALLDILGSTIIGGLLIITMLRMNASGLTNQSYFSEDLMVQENLRELVKIIEWDFRKIGYHIIPDQNGNIPMDQIFILADSTRLVFQSDIYRNGSPINISYQLGALITSTPNDSDRYLWRTVAGEPTRNIAAGLTRFRLRYLSKDLLKQLSPMPLSSSDIDKIGSIEVTLELQSPYVVKRENQTWQESYNETTTLWRQTRLVARNLNR